MWNLVQRILGLAPVPTDGMIAHREGFRAGDNPFPANTPAHSIWRDEFIDAARFRQED